VALASSFAKADSPAIDLAIIFWDLQKICSKIVNAV
jgi:hypothetical protein